MSGSAQRVKGKCWRCLRIGLLLVLLMAALALLAYEYFWISRPMGEGAAGPAVSRDPFRIPWTSQPVLVVGLGDSITAGFGASAGRSYFERLISSPPDEFPELQGICLRAVLPNLGATNLAVSGTTSIDHWERQVSLFPRAASNVLGIVVLTTGGNDLIHDYGRTPPREGAMYGATFEQARPWIQAFGERLEAMIRHLERSFPGGCRIFLATIYDPTDGVGDIESAGLPPWPDGLAVLAAYNERIAQCAAAHASVYRVDLHAAFLGHGLHCRQFWRRHYRWRDPHYWYGANLEDPSDRGYDAIRRLFLIEIAKAFR